MKMPMLGTVLPAPDEAVAWAKREIERSVKKVLRAKALAPVNYELGHSAQLLGLLTQIAWEENELKKAQGKNDARGEKRALRMYEKRIQELQVYVAEEMAIRRLPKKKKY